MKRKNIETSKADRLVDHEGHNFTAEPPAFTARHLHGVSLRNISFPKTFSRTADSHFKDDANSTLYRSTMHLQAPPDENILQRSRSIPDLQSSDTLRTNRSLYSTLVDETLINGSDPKISRRRATLDWSASNFRQRQQKIAASVAHRTADVFYSLHSVGYNEPLYVSEVVERSMNPTFQFFNLKHCGSFICQQTNLELKIWTKSDIGHRWLLFIHLTFNLKYLQFLNSSLDGIKAKLPENTVIFHLTDGVYISPQSFIPTVVADRTSTVIPGVQQWGSALQRDRTSSYEALLKLSTLQECIQDATSIHHRLASDIDLLIARNKHRSIYRNEMVRREDTVARLKHQIYIENEEAKCISARLSRLKAEIEARSMAMQQGRNTTCLINENIGSTSLRLDASMDTHSQCKGNIREQRRRVCEDLSAIYPINSVPDRPLIFTISAVSLPNSNFTNFKEDHLAAALGHVAHCVYLLSQYLCVPLPYPIKPQSSSSMIYDPISITLPPGSRTFPLYAKGTIFYRFEYGVYLLNKDIECLATRSGLRLIDIRQTLPNLKYLLFVVTAGKGEIPSRKAGGIRGLLREKAKEDDQTLNIDA